MIRYMIYLLLEPIASFGYKLINEAINSRSLEFKDLFTIASDFFMKRRTNGIDKRFIIYGKRYKTTIKR